MKRELSKHPWLGQGSVEVIGGRYDPSLLAIPHRLFAGAEPASDIQDMDALSEWAAELAERLASTQP